jgi:hypothetical protein
VQLFSASNLEGLEQLQRQLSVWLSQTEAQVLE